MIPIFSGSELYYDYSWLGRNDVKVECPLLLDLSSCVVLRCSPFILFQVSAASGSSELATAGLIQLGLHPNQEKEKSGCIHAGFHLLGGCKGESSPPPPPPQKKTFANKIFCKCT